LSSRRRVNDASFSLILENRELLSSFPGLLDGGKSFINPVFSNGNQGSLGLLHGGDGGSGEKTFRR
jgi:hypothetical protein